MLNNFYPKTEVDNETKGRFRPFPNFPINVGIDLKNKRENSISKL